MLHLSRASALLGCIFSLGLTLIDHALAATEAPVWEEVCSRSLDLQPREQVFCRVLEQTPDLPDDVFLSECYTPGTRYRVPKEVELSQVTWVVSLDNPVLSESSSLDKWSFTFPVDRSYLCHRLQRQIAFGQYKYEEAAVIVRALSRLSSHIGTEGLLSLPAPALIYLQRSISLQIKRSLSETELRLAILRSFRTIHPVR